MVHWLKRVMARAPISAILLLLAGLDVAHSRAAAQAMQQQAAQESALYVSPSQVDLGHIISPPPAEGSLQQRAELAQLHAIQTMRTPSQLAQAEADSDDESVFLFASVMGARFTAQNLPRTAALFEHLHHDVDLTEGAAKTRFGRLRPYAVDPTITGCTVSPHKALNRSYPSGHAITAYSEAIVLARLSPERGDAIMTRAREYSEERLVCGVHFASDIAAGETLGTVVALDILRAPAFQEEFRAAREELVAAGMSAR